LPDWFLFKGVLKFRTQTPGLKDPFLTNVSAV